MRIVQLHNSVTVPGGGEQVVASTTGLLRDRGHEVFELLASNRGLSSSVSRKMRAFCDGIYSRSAYSALTQFISQHSPEVVHAHNIYPSFSPSALHACRHAGVPVVLTCHDYRLSCPTSLHLRHSRICELCAGGHEYWCVIHNCRQNIFESVGYGLRAAVARRFRLIIDNVSTIIALTEFMKKRLVQQGFPSDRIVVLPNMVSIPTEPAHPSEGEYIGFCGRVSPEKGIEQLLAAAAHTGLPIRIAGDYSAMPGITDTAARNVVFVGHLDREGLSSFYRRARLIVVPSIWFEVCPLVILEAMSYGIPVLATRIGGLPELVDDGKTGLLFEPGNMVELAMKLRVLWDNPALCSELGQAGRQKAIAKYSSTFYYEKLIEVYERAGYAVTSTS